MGQISLGQPAPDFVLQSHLGETIELQHVLAERRVVLIFYPKDQTPGCTKQLCAARDDVQEYAQANVAVYGINGDSAASHERFVAKHTLTMPLLVDPGLKVAKAYDAVLGLGPLQIVNRTVVAIDQAGKIVFYQRGIPRTSEILGSFS